MRRGIAKNSQARPLNQPQCYGCSMIDIGTLAGLHARDHQLAAYCPRCDAWRVLRELVAQGRGSKPGRFAL